MKNIIQFTVALIVAATSFVDVYGAVQLIAPSGLIGTASSTYEVSGMVNGESATSTWSYDASSMTIADDDWVLNVETSSSYAGGLKIKSVNAKKNAGATVLNLAKPVLNADAADTTSYTVVVVKESAFKDRTELTALYLAEGFYEFGKTAFKGCTSLRHVSPLLPDSVRSIGEEAFYNCPIEGDFRLGFGASEVNFTNYRHFYNHRFSTVTFGPNAKSLAEKVFCSGNNTTLKEVSLHDGLTSWGNASFDGCRAITNLTPCLPKGISGMGWLGLGGHPNLKGTVEVATGSKSYGLVNNDAFSDTGFDTVIFGTNFNGKIHSRNQFTSMPNLRHFRVLGDAVFECNPGQSWEVLFDDKPYQLIVHVPAASATWQAVLADATQVTPWASLSDAIKAEFIKYFPNEKKPKGLIIANWSSNAATGTAKTLVNRWITDDASDTTFFVQGNPENAGSPSVPYGTTKNPTYPVTCTMTETAACGPTLYRTTGYTVQYVDEDGNPVGEPVTASGQSFTYDGMGGYSVVLTWNFTPIGYKANIVVPPGDWSVREDSTPDLEGGYYSPGSTATYTAVGNGFVRWFGDIGDNDPTSRTIAVALDQAKTLKPYFPSSWELAADGKTMSDGYWTLKVSGAADNLTVVAFSGDALPLLDLAKPVSGDGAVTSIGNSAFITARAVLEDLRLPETIKTIGQASFKDCVLLKKVTPLLPDSIAGIGQEAFYKCPIEGDFRVGFGASGVDFNSYRQFYNHRFSTITFGPNAKWLSEKVFCSENNTTLKEVILHDGLTGWGAAPFDGCRAITNLTPCLPKGISGMDWMGLCGHPNLKGTVEVATGSKSYGLVNNDAFSDTGFDTVVFGTNFNGKVHSRNQFTSMPNLRHFRVLGDANFEFNPENTWSVFFDNKPYQLIVHVPNPAKNASWKAVLEDPAQVTPWAQLDAATKAEFRKYFPDEKKPKGLIVANWSSNGAEGTTKTLVNRWIYFDATPGLTLIIR